MDKPAILLSQFRRIGDVMMTTPAVRAIRKSFPKARIDFLTEGISAEIFRHNPYIDEVIEVNKISSFPAALKTGLSLRKKRYDVYVDFFSHPLSGLTGLAAGIPRRIGFYKKGRKLFYTDRVEIPRERPYSPYHKLALAEAVGAKPDGVKLDFFISESDRKRAFEFVRNMGVGDDDLFVTLGPASRRPYKTWPPENFAYVADSLVNDYGAKIFVVYGPGEEDFARKVASIMKTRCLPLFPMNSLIETRALFERSNLHVSNDNGPCHFAVAAEIPLVTVFGKPRAVSWSPEGVPLIKTFDFDPGCKSSCRYPSCGLECLRGISPSAVSRAAGILLENGGSKI